jgi:hypothetical protein
MSAGSDVGLRAAGTIARALALVVRTRGPRPRRSRPNTALNATCSPNAYYNPFAEL